MTDVTTLSDADLVSLYKEVTAPLALPAGERLPPDRPLARWSDAELRAAYNGKTPLSAKDKALDVVQSGGIGLVEGGVGVAGLPGDLQALAKYLAKQTGVDQSKMEMLLKYSPHVNAPTSSDIKSGIEGYTGKFYEPKTEEGEALRTITGNWPAGVGPGGMVKNAVKFGAIPGAASYAASQYLEGNEYEPAGRAVAAGTAASVTAAIARPRTAAATVNRAMRGATEPQMQAAEQLFQDAQAAGQPITRAEAIQHVTNGATRMGNTQRMVEGQGELRPMMAQRAEQNAAAIEPVLDSISPPPRQPSMIGPEIGEAATNTIRDMERARTKAVTPYYDAAKTDRVVGREMREFVNSIDKQIKADKTGIIGSSLQEIRDLLVKQKPRAGKPAEVVLNDPTMPEPFATANPVKEVIPAVRRKNEILHNDLESLDRVRKYVRDKMEMPQIGADAITKEQGASILQSLDGLKQRMVDASPAFAQGNQLFQDITKKYLDPVMAGPLGKLAANKDIPTLNAIEILFPANPIPRSAEEVSTAVSALAQRSPQAARQLVRAHVERTFSEATQNLVAGPNEAGGAKFAAVIRGNPQQAANLEAAVRALPNGDQIYEGFDRFLTFVEAQGRRQPIGSNTSFNQQMLEGMKRGTPTQEATTALTGLGMQIPARARDAMERWRLGAGVAEIADLISNPRAGDLFRIMAKMPTGSQEAAILAGRITFLADKGFQTAPDVRK